MDRTTLGLTRLDAGESLSVDGFSFQSINPSLIDYFLRLGALLHHHDGHAAMDTPVDPLVLAVNPGGSIPASRDLYVTYTLLDALGGETLTAPPSHVTTPGPVPAPANPPTAVIDPSAGDLAVGTYFYAITYTDASGNETTRGPYVTVSRVAGSATAQTLLSNINAGMPAGATGWRLYKSVGTATGFRFIGSGLAADATFTDDGNVCADCTSTPPTINHTGSNSSLDITSPTLPPEATGFRLYGSDTGSFANPALLGEFDLSAPGVVTLTSWHPATGAPPVVATAVGGAAKINPATDLNDWFWKPPVADAAALPVLDNAVGDVRLTLDDAALHTWDGAAWVDAGGGGGGGGGGGTWTALTPYSDWAVATGSFTDGVPYPANADYIVQGNTVRLRGAVKRVSNTNYTRPDLFVTLPEALGPAQKTKIFFMLWDSSGGHPIWVWGHVEVSVGWATILTWYQSVDPATVVSFGHTNDVVILDGITWDITP